MGDDVEADSLGQRSALANGDNVALFDSVEAGRTVDGQVLVALLETAVLAAPVKVVTTDHNRVLHLRRDHEALVFFSRKIDHEALLVLYGGTL